MERAVNTFDFARTAKARFETGTAEEKTLILKTLGTNFTIKDGILDIDLKKPYLMFTDEYLVTQAELQTIEPEVLVSVGANNEGLVFQMVGVTGLEPATSRTPCVRASQLRHTPTVILN